MNWFLFFICNSIQYIFFNFRHYQYVKSMVKCIPLKKKRRMNCHQVKQNNMINRYEVTNRKILSLKHIYN